MSQSIITLAFEQYKAEKEATATAVELNEFVLANIPNQDPTQPIDRNEGLPPQNQIVHIANVTQTGFVNPNAVVYSLIMDTRIGDFEFNWVGLRNKQSGVLASILHIPTISKFKSVPGVQNGNSVTRSILMAYEGAKNTTGITVDASTWQIDFTARLFGIDEAERLVNLDVFGQAAFLADGFKVKKSGSNYLASVGRGYVGGLRCHLDNEVTITGVSNSSAIYLDVSWQGQLTSRWQTVFEIKVSKSALSDYVDEDGYQHYVTKIADINSAGNVVDTRHVEGFSEHLRHDEQATKAEAEAMTSSVTWLSPLRWKEAFLSRLSNSFSGTRTDYAASEKALNDGLGTKSDSSHDHDVKYWKRDETVDNSEKLNGLTSSEFQRVKMWNANNVADSYRTIAFVDGSMLGSVIRLSGKGTTGGTVWTFSCEILVNHAEGIIITGANGNLTEAAIKIYSNRNEDFFIQLKGSVNRPCNLTLTLQSLCGEVITTYSDGYDIPSEYYLTKELQLMVDHIMTTGSFDVKKQLKENGARVYSPNNPIPEALRIPVDVLDSRVVGVLRRNNTNADLFVCVGGATNGPISHGRVDGIPVGLFGPHSGVTGRTSISFIVKPNSEYIIDSNVFVELWTEYQVV